MLRPQMRPSQRAGDRRSCPSSDPRATARRFDVAARPAEATIAVAVTVACNGPEAGRRVSTGAARRPPRVARADRLPHHTRATVPLESCACRPKRRRVTKRRWLLLAQRNQVPRHLPLATSEFRSATRAPPSFRIATGIVQAVAGHPEPQSRSFLDPVPDQPGVGGIRGQEAEDHPDLHLKPVPGVVRCQMGIG
jgi:hypothetical protein